MDEREIVCKDGSRWRAIVATRSSLHRLELVFESLDEGDLRLRGEAPAGGLEELSDEELCFLVTDLRRTMS